MVGSWMKFGSEFQTVGPTGTVVLDLATQEGCKAKLTWMVVTSRDNLPTRDCHYRSTILSPAQSHERDPESTFNEVSYNHRC